MSYEAIFRVEGSQILTDAVLATFKRHYEQLEINAAPDSNAIDFVVSGLTEPRRQSLRSDLDFFYLNPQLPLENICNNFWNYEAKNETQAELLQSAQDLIKFQDPSHAAGLFIYGEAGIGKTHIAVATTKELMKAGQEVYYLSVPNFHYGELHRFKDSLNANQVCIIDDLNSPYGMGMDLFRAVVANAHDRGGRVFITGNTSYEQLMTFGFVGMQEERPRFIDRTKGMFKVLEVTGESSRVPDVWYRRLRVSKLTALRAELDQAVAEEEYRRAAELRDEIAKLLETNSNH